MISVVLTIAGSDSSGGAGIQADLKSFVALGVYGASAITAITAQNTHGVSAVHPVPADIVAAQITAVPSDLDIRAVCITPNLTEALAAAREQSIGQGAGPVHHFHALWQQPSQHP
jgi:hydroxymethylpyrimidine kinase/phosphomethylpyrimidine kinase